VFTISPNEGDKGLRSLYVETNLNLQERIETALGTNHIVKGSILQEMFPYCGKISGHCLSLRLILGRSCYAMRAQAPMAFYGNFSNGEEILRLKNVRTPILQPNDACITEIFTFLASQENPCPTLFSSTRSTTASMRKRLGICRWVELQNRVHIRDI
jgi:hypothetical protein